MKHPQKRTINWNYQALAFALPFVGMLMIMIIKGCAPFGTNALLYSDAYHQYYPFFKAYRQALLSGESLLYSWDVGMGMDYLGLISYYLASPLNLLSVFVPEDFLVSYFCLLTPIRMGLAGWFFAIFLNKIFDKDDLSISIFGAFYATCAWVAGYRWNVMWMDTFALLPLVVLGTVCLLRDKKFILYTLSLFIAIFANYYVGFFVCIFVALVFFCYEICRWQGFKRFFMDLGRIALFSLLAIGMTAILELPAFAALQTTQSSINKFPTKLLMNIADEHSWRGFLNAVLQVAGQMAGAHEPVFKEGLPNLYCGVGTMMLAFLYLTAKEIKIRDKICAVFLLLFFNVSFIIRPLDYIWHGFHFTNMIPYRFSFLYSFVVLYMGYHAWTVRKSFRLWQLIFAGVMCLAVTSCTKTWQDTVYLPFNLGFIAMYLGALIYGWYEPKQETDPNRSYIPTRELQRREARLKLRQANTLLFLSVIMIVELIMNLVNMGAHIPLQSTNFYPRGTTYSASMIRYMKEREDDTLFYRAETAHAQTLNDGALNDYHGVSTFTSSANVKVTEFMHGLGYGAKNTYNRYCYEEGSPVSDLFLGVKYMIERDGNQRGSSVFTDVHSYGKVHLLRNNAYLPLGFLAEEELGDLVYTERSNMFVFQNELFAAATGIEGDVWRLIGSQNLDIVGQNVDVYTWTGTGYCSYGNALQDGQIVYEYEADAEGFLCIYLYLPKRNDVTIRVNDQLQYSETTSLGQMMAVCDVVEGDRIRVEMTCDADESSAMTLTAAIMNMDRFWKGYEKLNASTMELTSFSNTKVEGTIHCDRDGLLYTSIPQNGNWHVYVDGEKTEIQLVCDTMVGVKLTEGDHTLRFVYRNEAFSWGWKISLLSALIFGALVWFIYKPDFKPKPGKYQKK